MVLALGTVVLVWSTSGGLLSGQEPLSRSVAATGTDPWVSRAAVMVRDGTLALRRVQTDTMIPGRTHERLEQRHLGLPVYGGELIRQMNGSVVESIVGRLFENVSVATTTPAIAAADAAGLAAAAAGEGAIPGDPQLGILPTDGRYELVYRTTVRGLWDARTISVNAVTGAIEENLSQIRHQDVPTIAPGVGVLRDQKKVSSIRTGAGLQAIDAARPHRTNAAASFTLDFKGNATRFSSFLQTNQLFDSDIAMTSTSSWTDMAVVDAHVYQGWVYDYYFKRFGRRGLDDEDGPIIGIVHPLARRDVGLYPSNIVGTFINNAAYLSGYNVMVYGDGDGVVFDFLAGALDVVAHELTHGVTEFTSELGVRDEPGALNEAFSDIMAAGVEFFHLRAGQGPQRGPNFVLGEDVTRFGAGIVRSMSNPNALGDPDHYSLRRHIGTSVDDGGVHVNSTIVSHAFYLAVVGGTNRVSGIAVQGVGLANMERMERIFYRGFVTKLTARAQFSDARAATLQAATELFGADSFERAQLLQAWTAVGVR
jgi:Zn-dependent metalloprotease